MSRFAFRSPSEMKAFDSAQNSRMAWHDSIQPTPSPGGDDDLVESFIKQMKGHGDEVAPGTQVPSPTGEGQEYGGAHWVTVD